MHEPFLAVTRSDIAGKAPFASMTEDEGQTCYEACWHVLHNFRKLGHSLKQFEALKFRAKART